MDINTIKSAENLVYAKPRLLNDRTMHYCPGCSHGVVHRLIAELLDEMGQADNTIAVAPVGCAVFAYNYIDVDWIEAAHGRAPAVATAAKRQQSYTQPGGSWSCIVFRLIEHRLKTYQTALILH